jgi:hypothetical protein
MGLRRSKPVIEAPPADTGSLIASAVRMGLSEEAWRGYRFTDEAWQKQAWDFYDTNPQLHNAIDYIGAACSMIRVYVAEVDENGVRQGEVDHDSEIGALSETLFGGPANKAEILRAIGESLSVAGECFILGRAAKTEDPFDRWWVAAPSEVRRQGDIVYVQMGRAVREELNPGRDIVIRVWTPHPRRAFLADSPVRALLSLLFEMEQMQMFIRSQMNSRIANATILPVPSTLAAPKGDSQAVGTDDIYQQLFEVITSNLEGRGTAAQVAPILWQMPLAELTAMAGVQPIRFDSPLSDQAIELRKEQQQKLAIGINVPTEIQVGGREMNHWSIWWAGEEFIIKTVMPLMNRIVDALTTAYLVPALKALGKDPAKYTYWYDTAPLANSANKLADALNLYAQGIVSASTVRREGSYSEADAPSKEEENTRYIKEVILRDPTLFASQAVREEIGIEIEDMMPELSTPPPPPPAPGRVPSEPQPGQKPKQPAITDGINEPPANQGDLIASLVGQPSPVVMAANGLVVRALEIAGKKMLTPTHRGMFPDTPAHELHTKIRVASEAHAETLLAGAWDNAGLYFDGTNADIKTLTQTLHAYTKGLLRKSIEHRPSLLAALLSERETTR